MKMKMSKEELEYLKAYAMERFHNKIIARDFMAVRELDSSETNIGVIPILDNSCPLNSLQKTDFSEFNKTIDALAQEEDMLCLTGEHSGWGAFGIKGLLTSANTSFASCGNWPKNVFNDIIIGRKILRDYFGQINPILIVPNHIYSSLELIAWSPPENYPKLEPQTYLNILLNQGLIYNAYSTNSLFTNNGGKDSVLFYQPTGENFIIESLKLTVNKYGENNDARLSIKEAIAPCIKDSTAIVEISSVVYTLY